MRFGLFGGPARRGPITDDKTAYATYRDTVLEAERLGFYGAYLVEHHFTGQGQVSASLGLLTYLAGLTTTIRLGSAVVVVPWHNPALLAEQAATLDLLSDGRLDLGLGRGYRDREFQGFGIPREESDGRFRETLEFLRRAWSTNERFTFEGQYWSLKDVVIEPKPVQRPHPPLWVGAASAVSIADAAKNGLRLFLDQVATIDEVAERVKQYREAQTAAGRPAHPHDIALTRPLLLANSARERELLLESHLATLKFLSDSTQVSTDNPFYSLPESRRERVELGAILGEPQECIERLQELNEIGVHQVLFTRTSQQSLRSFVNNVVSTTSFNTVAEVSESAHEPPLDV